MNHASIRTRLAPLAVALCLLAGALVHPGLAHANSNQISIMQDDDQLLYSSPARVQRSLALMKSLGVEYVRVTVLWSLVANGTTTKSGHRKAHFDPRNPAAYPHHNWDRYDFLVRAAQAAGISVYFNPTGPGPRWAHAKAPRRERRSRETWLPKAPEFYKFAYALGVRYNGRYRKEIGDRGVLPRVSVWSIWNEPNQGGWLTPQSYRSPVTGQVIPYAPIIYRELYFAARQALRDSGHDSDAIFIGETAPEGRGAPSSRNPLAPKLFIRELLCVDPRGVAYTGADAQARECSLFARNGQLRATAWAHHPYTKKTAPTAPSPSPDAITIANIGDLPALLDDLAVKSGHIATGLGVMDSEFGYETNPPDPFNGITLDQQAEYINLGDFFAFLQPRVYGTTQFLLRDAKPNRTHPKDTKAYWDTYQSGLLLSNGRQKASLAAYKLPFVAFGAGNDPISGAPQAGYWGQLRFRPHGPVPTPPDQVQLQYAPEGTQSFEPLGPPIAVTNTQGFFVGKVKSPGPGLMRAQWRGHAPPYVATSRAARIS